MAEKTLDGKNGGMLYNPWIQTVIAILGGITISIVGSPMGWQGLAIGWISLIFAVTLLQAFALKKENNWLRKRLERTLKFEELFFRSLVGSEVIQGGDLPVGSKELRGFQVKMSMGWLVDILVFSEERFDFFLVDSENAQKLKMGKSTEPMPVNAIMNYERIAFLRTRYLVVKDDQYTFAVRGSGPALEREFTVYMVISRILQKGR